MRRCLVHASQTLLTAVIVGPGGFGKSQLAGWFARQEAGHIDIIAWIHAKEGGTADLAGLARLLGAPKDVLSPTEGAHWALDWLSTTRQSWLLILDDVTDIESLARTLRRCGDRGRIIVTTRDRALTRFGESIAIEVFDEDTATEYLVRHAGRPHDGDAARLLARALGCLPLALSHAAAYCQDGTSFTEYLELLGGLPAAELFDDADPEPAYRLTVSSTWKASIAKACAVAELAADVLRRAAQFAAAPIPKLLFDDLVEPTSISARRRLKSAFRALARFSLATVDDTTLTLHTLLGKIVREEESDNSQARRAQAALRAALDPRSARAPSLPGDASDRGGEDRCEQLLPHVLAFGDERAAGTDADEPVAIELHNALVRYLLNAGRRRQAVDIAERTLGLADVALERNPAARTEATPLTEAWLRARVQLAEAGQWAGDTEPPLTHAEEVAATCDELLGAEHPTTLDARAVVALWCQWRGLVTRACTLTGKLADDRARIQGAMHPDTFWARLTHAWALSVCDRYQEAKDIREDVLAQYERLLGDEHRATSMRERSLRCPCATRATTPPSSRSSA